MSATAILHSAEECYARLGIVGGSAGVFYDSFVRKQEPPRHTVPEQQLPAEPFQFVRE